MARMDQVQSTLSGFRCDAAAACPESDYGKLVGYGLDAQGRGVHKGAGQSGFVGVTIRDKTTRKAKARLDIFQLGEVVEMEGLAAGTKYYLQNDGTLGTTRTAFYVGHTTVADHLVLRFSGKADA